MPTVHDLRVDSIVVGKRLRPVVERVVSELAESMATVGLINPILISRAGRDIVPRLVAGAHRLAAAKRLGWETIPCLEHAGADADDRMLIEIDENLIRAELSPAERAIHIQARKEIYERVHPETKTGAAPGKAGGGKVAKNANFAPFAKDTAAKTGRSRRSVEADATRARGIAQIADVIGTSLDKGAELDALRKLPPAEQAKLIAAAKEGQPVSAQPPAAKIDRPEPEPVPSPAEPIETGGPAVEGEAAEAERVVSGQVEMLWRLWTVSRPEARRRFRERQEREAAQ